MKNCIFVTGGAGFIGSAVIRHLLSDYDCDVVNLDKLTYAGNLETLQQQAENPRYHFVQVDICDRPLLDALFVKYQPKAVMHLAAESHVDRSIDGPADFIRTNIEGTFHLLEAARHYCQSLTAEQLPHFRFHHISTDEVYGTLSDTGLFTESTPYQPNSPYSSSKAASDHLVRAWHETYGLPVVLSNCSNNYGPYQYPEKLIPVIIEKALAKQPIPIYGKGDNVRDWLYVDDHATALALILHEGTIGRSYNVGGNEERTNLQVVETVCDILNKLRPLDSGEQYQQFITFVEDRIGHDKRYAIDATRIQNELGWQPSQTFASGIENTIIWYLNNQSWVNAIKQKSATLGERLGKASRLGGH